MKIAVGYLRCSTDMQDDSVEQQRREVQKWADANDFQIIRWYEDEGKSGTTFEKRPAFMRLIRDIEAKHAFDFVLVYDESRWGRPNNPRENTYWKVHAERYGVRVRVINSSSKHENDIGSFVTEVVESAEASEYSKKLSRSTLRGSKANAEKGYSSGGTAPYGYARMAIDKSTGQNTRILKEGEWSRSNEEKVVWTLGDPLEIATVQRIFEMKSRGFGLVTIADLLNSEEVPCPKRGRWRSKDQKWCQGTIRSIITNEAYYGARVYNKHPQSHMTLASKERWINDPAHWILKENSHPAIITKELFNLANHTNKRPMPSNRPQIIKSEYLLSGLIMCGKCGFNFSGQRYAKQRIAYYQDSGYINKGRSVCTSYLIRKEKIEEYVVRSIKENMLASNLESHLLRLIERRLEQHIHGSPSLTLAEQALETVEKQIQHLVEAIAHGIQVDTVVEKVKGLEKERDRLKREIDKARSFVPTTGDIRDLARRALAEIHNFEKVFDSAPHFMKKHLIRQFVLQIVVDRERNRAVCHIMKIPMVNHPLMSALMPSELSKCVVAGAGLEPAAFGL